jgi:tetratricopeptide (TPR) repeat protein
MARKKNKGRSRPAPAKSPAPSGTPKPAAPKQTAPKQAAPKQAAPKKKGAPPRSSGAPKREGFDDVDDFFFGSETGSFARDEFDYDPFDDHTAPSGAFEAAEPGAPQATRVVMDVPAEIKAQLIKEREGDKPEPKVTAKIAAKAPADEPTAPSSPAKKAEPDEPATRKHDKITDAQVEKASAKKPSPPASKKASNKKATSSHKAKKGGPKVTLPPEPKPVPDAADPPAEDPEDLPEPQNVPAPTPEPEAASTEEVGEETIPLSQRRAAGAARAAEMALDDQVFAGDDDGGEAIAPADGEATQPASERRATEPGGSSLTSVPSASAVSDSELPGAGEWGIAVHELLAEGDAQTAKKASSYRAALYYEVGRVLAARVGDWSAAEARWEAALDASGDFVPALRELVRLKAGREEWAEAVALLARQAKAASQPAGRTAALLASAHIQLSHLDELPGAAADLRAALDAAPDNYVALRFLREIHYRTQSWSALVEVLHQARDLAATGERLRIDYELGRLHDEVLKAPTEAVNSFRTCLDADGRFIPALLAAERLLLDAGDTTKLLELYRSAAAGWGGPDASFWYARAARAGDAASLSPDAVDQDFRNAIAASPEPEVVSEEYRHWLAAQGRWDGLVSACEDALDGDAEPALRAHLLATLGRVALQHAGDSQGARARFDEALQADPGCVDAQDGRRQVLIADADWAGLLEHLDAQANDVSDNRLKVALNLKMAEVCEDRLEDVDGARSRLEAACLLAPSFLPALDALIAALGRLGQQGPRAERLEQAAGLVDRADARAAYLLRASRAWETVGDRDRAIAALQKAAEAGPGPLLAREWLVDAYEQDGRWAEAADALRQAAAEADDPSLKAAILYRAGRVSLARLKDEDAAEAAYRSLLDLAPDFFAATLDLADIYAARGDWDAYGLLQQQMAEASSGDRALWLHLGAGEAYERAGRAQDAIEQYRAAVAASPGSAVAASSLRRVFRKTGDHSALADAYGQQLRGTTDRGRADALRVQLIETLRMLGDAGGVSTEVTELLKSDQGDRLPLAAAGIVSEALQLWDSAMAVYEAVGDQKGAEAGARAACLFQAGLLREEVQEDGTAAAERYERALSLVEGHAMALEGLERVHSQTGDGAGLADVYDREARAADAQPVRTFYALLAGEQFENLSQSDRAVGAYRLAFEDPVGRQRACDALRRLALEANDGALLREMNDALVGKRKDPEAIARIMELGEGLAATGDHDGAVEAFNDVLARRKGFLPAAYHLERLAHDREDWNAALSALEVVVDNAKSDSVRKGAEARTQGLLADKGVTSDSAYDFYKKLHEREPDNLVALRGLGGIHLARAEYKDAAGFLEQLAEKSAEPAGRADAAAQLGQIAREANEDVEGAVAYYEQALDHVATHRPSLEALRAIHTSSENWTSLVGVVAREANAASEERRLPFYVEIARIWQDKIDNPKVAVSSWQKVLQSAPGHGEAQIRLLDLYEAAGDWKGYLDVAERGLAGLSGEQLRDRQAELGQMAYEQAGDADRAIGLLRAAIRGDQPSALALSVLREIVRSRGDWEQVISLTEQQVEVAKDDAERVTLLEDAARIKLDQLLDRDGAAILYKQAIGLDSNCEPALGFFVHYYFDTEQWEEALPVFAAFEVIVDRMDIEEDDDDRIEATAYHYKYGVVLSRNEQDDESLAQFGRALELTPTHLPSLEAAAPRYFEAGEWQKTKDTSRAILRLRGGTGDSASLTKLYLRLGRSELELGDVKNALKRFKKALDQSPNHVDALQGIASIHQISGDWNSLLSTYNSIIKYARDPDQVILAYMTKGDVLEQKLHFTDKAVLHYEKVLMYDKQNVSAMTRLSEIALRAGDLGRGAEFAGRASSAARTPEDTEQARILEVLAGADPVDVKELTKGGDVDGSERVASFRASFDGEKTVGRTAAINAFRASFCGL